MTVSNIVEPDRHKTAGTASAERPREQVKGPSWQALLTAAQAGDRDALNRVLARLPELVQRRVGRRQSSDQIDDLTQDIALVLLRRLPQLRAPDRFFGWLNTIVDNQLRMAWRAARRRAQLEQNAFVSAHHASHGAGQGVLFTDVAEIASDAEGKTTRAVSTAVRNLSPDHQAVIDAYYVKRYSYAQAANQLELPIGTVKSRLQKARQQLRLALGGTATSGGPSDTFAVTPPPLLQRDAHGHAPSRTDPALTRASNTAARVTAHASPRHRRSSAPPPLDHENAIMNNALNLDPDALATLAATASFCHSDQAKPHSAMLLRKSGVAVATDGHRMAVMSLPALAGLDDDVQVRPNGLTDLARAIGRGGAHGELSVALDEMSLQLNTDANPGPDSKWAWPIQVETFPDYERVIPTAQPVQIRLNAQLLQRALVQLRPFLEAGHPELDGFEYFPCVELRVNTVDQRMSLRVDQSLGYHPVADGVANEPGSAAVATLPSATGDTQFGAPQLRWHHQVDLKLEPVHGVTERFTVRRDGHYLDDAIALLAPAAGGSGPGPTVAMHLTDATSVVSLYDASGARSYFLMPVK